MNTALERLAAEVGLADPGHERLRLAFGHACALRVRHLLEEPEVLECLRAFTAHAELVSGDDPLLDGQLAALAEHAARLANRHPGSRSIDGCGHAAVSGTYAVAKAIQGRPLEAASYAAYALVYAQGGTAAVADRESFEPEFVWQVETLQALARTVRLRSARPQDALCIGVLAMQVFLDTYATQGMRPDLAREVLALCSPEAFGPRLRDPARHFFLAERAGHLLGFAECAEGSSAPLPALVEGLELARLYVQRHAHGEGIGAALLARAEGLAREQRRPLLWLTAWAGNANARGFYRARGYEDVGTTDYVFEGRHYENRVFCRRLGNS